MTGTDVSVPPIEERSIETGTDWTLDVVRGLDALRETMTAERVAQWRALARRQRKVTAFQGPDFALPWYATYAERFEPILLIGLDGSGVLVGIMPLARRGSAGSPLVPAGAEQAEYSGWLADDAIDEAFPAACVVRLRGLGLFDGVWSWKWLAPGTGTAWLERTEVRACGIRFRTTDSENPIWSLEREEGVTFYGKHKSHRWKMNRLKRLGEVRLIQLDASSLTDELFECFKTLYDIRQLARNGVAPFLSDPCKGPFHRRLLEQSDDSAICFALIAGTTPIAFNFDLVDGKRVIGCMTPFDQRWFACSPGKIIGDLVADELSGRGMLEFDLTPGGDEYKQELATRNEPVQYLRLFGTAASAAASDRAEKVRGAVKTLASAAGLTREHLEKLRETFALAARQSPTSVAAAALGAFGRWIYARDVALLFRLGPGDASPAAMEEEGPEIAQDRLTDFLCYADSDPWLTHHALMSTAVRRIDQGEHGYSVLGNDELLHWAWLQLKCKKIRVNEVGIELEVAKDTAFIHGFHTAASARGSGLEMRTMRRIVADAIEAGAEQVLISVTDNSRPGVADVESLGFRPSRRLTRRRLFGRESFQEQAL